MDIDGGSVGCGAEVEPTAREEPDGRSLWLRNGLGRGAALCGRSPHRSRGWAPGRFRFVAGPDPKRIRSGDDPGFEPIDAQGPVPEYGARPMRSECPGTETGAMDSHVALEQRLELARARRDAQPAYSPDWDAAMGDIDELTARLARLAILARAEQRVPASA